MQPASGSKGALTAETSWQGNDASLNGRCSSLGAIRNTHLAQQIIDVRFDGGFGDVQMIANLFVAVACHNQAKNV
jgi:hypothetical protein